MAKHIFIDMDGTLTRSRCSITDEMKFAVSQLVSKGVDIVVVSGAKKEQIFSQIGSLVEEVAILAQNGNDAENSIGRPLWKNELTWLQKMKIFKLCNLLTIGIDNVQDRGCQISYSIIGHSKPIEEKELADPLQVKRKRTIESWKASFDELLTNGIYYTIAGTTCIDFYCKTKGENVSRYISEMEWKKDDCVYIGDALFEGGNDATVTGIIQTIPVTGPNDTLKILKNYD